jgi:hypothetical protein
MVYPGAPDQKKPYDAHGKVLPGVIVNSAAEADEALGIDRSEPETEAPAPVPKARTPVPTSANGTSRMPTAEDARTDLIAEAERLGIQQFDKTWSVARMQDTIDTFKTENEVV